MSTFSEKLTSAQRSSSSILCVGLDPDPDRLPTHLRAKDPAEAVVQFCSEIIGATSEACCAYKPNLAFFEALGPSGAAALDQVVRQIPKDRIIIADGKRGDIGNTAVHYARSIFDRLGCDACTVSPYMGSDAVIPFLRKEGAAAFVLIRTSNPSSAELQMTILEGSPLYLRVAEMANGWGKGQPGEIGFVVGATDPSSLELLRDLYPGVPFLIPGIGAQGGNPEDILRAARPESSPVVVNASRSILYAGSGEDFAERAREAAFAVRDSLNTSKS